LTIVVTTPATADTSSNPQNSSFEDGFQSNDGASSDKDDNED
jgi:hypothetical protein